MRIPDPKPKSLVKFHFTMMVLWAGNFPMLLLGSVRASVAYVAFCSVYANFVGHFSGWDAARAELQAEEKK